MAKNSRPTFFDVFLLMFLGLLVRVFYLQSTNCAIDADEAIVGLMASRISNFTELPIFYYGQNYMGSIEPLLAALIFKIFGVSQCGLLVAPTLFFLLVIPLVYYLSSKIGGKRAAFYGTLLFVISPQFLLEWSTKARGGYTAILFFGTLALSSIYIFQSFFRFFIAGIATGINFWISPLSLVFWPAIFWGYVKKISIKSSLMLLAGFLVGALPWLQFNLAHNFVSVFELSTGAASPKVGSNAYGLISNSIPILFGLRHDWSVNTLTYGAVFLLIFVVLIIIVSGIRGIFERLEKRDLLIGCCLIIVTNILLFLFSGFGSLSQNPRYLLPIYIGFIPIFVYFISPFVERIRFIPQIIILIVSVYFFFNGIRYVPEQPHIAFGERVSEDHTNLINYLNDKNIFLIRTNYWIGYRLAFETNEKIRFQQFKEPRVIRIPEYEESASEEVLYLPLVLSPKQFNLAKKGFKCLGILFEHKNIDGYIIVVPQKDPPLSKGWGKRCIKGVRFVSQNILE